jgi:stage II sporulation protein D
MQTRARSAEKQSVNVMSLAWNSVVRFLTVLAALIALAATTASAQPASTPGEALFVVSGRGWGHGVGMSQYGAYGMALEGRTHADILKHFYTGTQLGRASSKKLRVLLAEGRSAVTISSKGAITARDASGTAHKFPKGVLTLRPNLLLAGAGAKGRVKAASPLLLRPRKGRTLTFDGHPFRGDLELQAQGGFLNVINVVPLDSYIQGVVANEMPFSWPAEALEAQAIAARTYALASIVKGKPYHLFADVRDQVYRGVEGETAQTNAAVAATAGKVVTHGGRIATTFYFSSSGGKTANSEDVFGGPVPYLVSRPDPWDRASPHHRWGPVLIGARTVQSKLGGAARVIDLVGAPTPSGRFKSLTVQTLAGSTKVPGVLLRTSLGLRSTYVTIGVLRLDRPSGRVPAGAPLMLTGLARGLTSPVLASSVDGGSSWKPVGPLARDANGGISHVVMPDRTTRYRIQTKEASSPPILVQVAK